MSSRVSLGRLRRRTVLGALLLAAVACTALLSGCGGASDTALRVVGNRLEFGANGRVVQLRGVNRSGTEYQCVKGVGFFQSNSPMQPDSAAMISAMKSWDIDVVRVPLNEGCWLGVNAPSQYSGAAYRSVIAEEVHRLTAAHLFVVLSLQWAGPGTTESNLELPMADASHAPAFWRSVARTFRKNTNVMFDLFNEPFNIGWSCWEHGCEIPAGSGPNGSWSSYQATGMQQLVTAVRSTGATQPLLLGGLDYSLNLSGWLAHRPQDPDNALVASVHTYGDLSPCDNKCEAAILKTSRQAPVVFGELGETDCSSDYINEAMAFADKHQIGYIGWAWDATTAYGWSCSSGPSLITSYAGTPTPYGSGFEQHLTELGPAVRP